VLVSTDLHGDLDAFNALQARFLALQAADPESHWVQLGDLVHGPDARAAQEEPEVYGYPDRSWEVVHGFLEAQGRYPKNVHFVLGNHDYGHLGGMHTAKFHPDEVEHLEGPMMPGARELLRAFFRRALLAVVTPCGAFLTHGSPDDLLPDLATLDAMDVPPSRERDRRILRSFLWAYGQPREVTERLLATVSRAGTAVRMVLHGHDKDPSGWFTEGGNQGCPVIFGAPRERRRCVLLDLTARYRGVDDLRDGFELLPVHG
jgi:predicted phosphodiesterase